MIREEMLEKLKDIRRRRTDAFSKADSTNALDAIPEATTIEDIMTLYQAVEMLDEFEKFVVELSCEIAREWGYKRCSVCGHTPKQAKALNYDCAIEC